MPEVVIGNFGNADFPTAADGISAGLNVSGPATPWTNPPPPPVQEYYPSPPPQAYYPPPSPPQAYYPPPPPFHEYYPPPSPPPVYYPPSPWEQPPTASFSEQPLSTFEHRPPQSPGYYKPPMRVYSPPPNVLGRSSSWPQRITSSQGITRFTALSTQVPANASVPHIRRSGAVRATDAEFTRSLTTNNILLSGIRPHSTLPANDDAHSMLISINGMGSITRTTINSPLFGNVKHKTEREIEEIRKLLEDLRKNVQVEQKKVDIRAENLVRELLSNLASSVTSHIKGINRIIKEATQARDLVEQAYYIKDDPHLPESTIEKLRESIKQYEGPDILGSDINCVGFRQMYQLDLIDRKTATWPLNFPLVLSRAPVGSFFDELTGGDPAEMEFERAFGQAQKELNQAVADKAEEELNERLNRKDLQELIQPLIDDLQTEFGAWEAGGIGGAGSKGTFLKSKLEDALCSYMSNVDCAKPCSRICTLISAHIWVLHGPVRAFAEKVLLWQQEINLPSGTVTRTRYQFELRIEIPFYIEGIFEVLLECI